MEKITKCLFVAWGIMGVGTIGMIGSFFGNVRYEYRYFETFDLAVPVGIYGYEIFVAPTILWLLFGALIFSDEIYDWLKNRRSVVHK